MEKLSANEYQQVFDPSDYFQRYYAGNPPLAQHMLRCYHAAFQEVTGTAVKVLDYGAGPITLGSISAAAKASEIVLADYSANNRKALRQWLDGDAAAFDWTPHVTYAVRKLEGGADEGAVERRQERVRQLVKDVVHCDIMQDPPIANGYDQQYDVVISSLVMEGTSSTNDEYFSNMARLGKLVKPGGMLLYYGVENKQGYYLIGDNQLPNFHATVECALNGLKAAGFRDLSVEIFEPSRNTSCVFRFIKGRRN